jgi:hypothetical protein
MLYVFSSCHDFIRTVPAPQHDRGRAEDIDTGSEDHVADEARYGCMSRPWTPKPTEPVEVIYSSYRQADPPGTTEMEIFKRALI